MSESSIAPGHHKPTSPARAANRLMAAGIVAVAVILAAGAAGASLRDQHDRSSATRPDRVPPRKGVGFSSVRTNASGDQLVLAFTGSNPQLDATNRCFSAYDSDVELTPTEAIVTLNDLRPPTIGGRSALCTLEGHARYATVDLGEALGNRLVRDARTGIVHRPYDGARLLAPTALGPGWQLESEGGTSQLDAEPGWGRSFSRDIDSDDPAREWARLVVSQGSGLVNSEAPDGSVRIDDGSVRVDGRPVQVYARPDPGGGQLTDVRLVAEFDVGPVAIEGFRAAPAWSIDELVDVAESLDWLRTPDTIEGQPQCGDSRLRSESPSSCQRASTQSRSDRRLR